MTEVLKIKTLFNIVLYISLWRPYASNGAMGTYDDDEPMFQFPCLLKRSGLENRTTIQVLCCSCIAVSQWEHGQSRTERLEMQIRGCA